MKMIGKLLIIIGLTILAFYFVYNQSLEQKDNNDIEIYIEKTSIEEISIEDEVEEANVKESQINNNEQNKNSIVYTAVLEIPKINLKKGLVDSTNNFSSINYAISVDKNSNYPNEKGNFILYAHSGNSNIAYFRNLNKVNINDDIYVYFNGIKYHYIIYDKYDIEKTGKTKVITKKDDNYITLITCNQERKGYQVVVVGKLKDKNLY